MASFTVEEICLHRLQIPLNQPFSTHLQTVDTRESIILEMIDTSGEIGLGECVAFSSPWYTEETIQTCMDALTNWLIPPLLNQTFHHPSEVLNKLQFVKGNRMAKATIDSASWDLFAKKQEKPLWHVIGGVEKSVEAGIVLTGKVNDELFQRVAKAADIGYKRVKIKIDRSTDPVAVKHLVQRFPNMLFYGDANGLFHELGIEQLLAFDEAKLTLIEQPFLEDDWDLHREATKQMMTPIALDESIRSVEDVERMIAQRAGDIIVLKPGRVGGITPSLAIHTLARQHQYPVWIGGMIELGISKAHNLALATLPQVSLPGDFSASDHFWEKDIVSPPIIVEHGAIQPTPGAGIGYTINDQQLTSYTITKKNFDSI